MHEPQGVPAPVEVPEPPVEDFMWSQVADPDFRTYRDQLLALGCPERTTRLIVLAEINQAYCERRRNALAAVQAQFWDLIGEGPDKLEKMAKESTRAIEEERRKMIDDVLGSAKADPEEEAANQARAAANERARYAWLPEEKRDQMLALDKQLNEASAEMWKFARDNNKDRQPTTEAKAKQKELEQQIKLARQNLLTPEEFNEFELRTSGAGNWAWNAAGFEPTEEEWRQVAKLQKDHNDKLQELNENKATSSAEKQARTEEIQRLNVELAQAREAALGPERAAEYARANDRDYRQVRAVIEKYGLDDALAREVYELQRIAMKQADTLRRDKTFDAETRGVALDAIRQETERTLEQTMGKKAFNTYKKYDEGWFGRLGRP